MSKQTPENILSDPQLGGTWVTDPGHTARPFDIGGMNEDGTYRPGTMFLEDYPHPPSEIRPSDIALGGSARVIAPDQLG